MATRLNVLIYLSKKNKKNNLFNPHTEEVGYAVGTVRLYSRQVKDYEQILKNFLAGFVAIQSLL